MSNPVISVRGIGKKYKLGATLSHDTFRDHITHGVKSIWHRFRGSGRLLYSEGRKTKDDGPVNEIWALKNINFDVNQGEVVGIIGRNGAGKSTLLKILSQITEPTEGEAHIRGRIASLLEVGTGFHPELTGRENIYLNGAILGMTRTEIKSKFDEIVAFAELEKFIDTPVKRYSSGMFVRLAFAVAAHLEPEILLVDEVLAVGDASFQKKCLGKIGEVSGGGRTVLFVSHDMNSVSTLCGRVMLLEKGQKSSDGLAEETIRRYLSSAYPNSAEWTAPFESPNGPVVIRAVRVRDAAGQVRSEFNSYEEIFIEMDLYVSKWHPHLKIGFELEVDWGGTVFATFHNDIKDISGESNFCKGLYRLKASVPKDLLASNNYYVSPCATIHRRRWLFKEKRVVQFKVNFQNKNPELLVGHRPGVIGPLLDWGATRLSPLQ